MALELIKIGKFTKKEFNKKNTLAIKGIAIMLMIFHHTLREDYLWGDCKVSFYPLGKELVTNLCFLSKICVSMFAFLTGYGLTLSLKKLSSKYEWKRKEIYVWISNRIIKLISNFFIVAILAYIICQIIDGYTGQVFFKDNNVISRNI